MSRRIDDAGQEAANGLEPKVFRALLDNAGDAIQVTDPETHRFIYVNEASLHMHGYSREELMSLSVHDIDPYISKSQMQKLNKALRTDRSALFEGFHRRKDGSEFPVEVHLSQVRIDGKDWRIAVVRDIMARKKAETSLQLFRSLLDKASDAIEVIDPETLRFLDVNEAACHSLGYSRDELLALSIWNVDTEMGAVPVDEVREALGRGESVTHESRHRRKDGSTFPVEVIISQVRLDRTYNIAVARDISERKQHAEMLRQSLEQSILAIADTVEARDPYTAGHQRRVGALASAIAREMGLPEDRIQGLYLAGLIHDLGKIQVPAEILSKPGHLSEVEYMLVRTHPQAGYDILKNVEFPWPIAEIILQHHERLDGSGYPQGLKDKQILTEAKILAVADVVESMASHRPYRPGLGMEAGLEEIESKRGVFYDPQAVDACLRLFHQQGYVLPG